MRAIVVSLFLLVVTACGPQVIIGVPAPAAPGPAGPPGRYEWKLCAPP